MGYGNAQGMNRHVKEGNVKLDAALLWHLTSNHYPPVPEAMVPVARKAIEFANIGELDADIQFPDGWIVNGLDEMSVSKIVEIMHLDAFIEQEDSLWTN